jgi:hypothetical protein
MEPLFAYLLKMLLCSGILLGYYYLALRNERFHHWNRFYLLSALLLSVLVPFGNIPLQSSEEKGLVVDLLTILPWNRQAQASPIISWKNTLLLIALLVSFALFIQLLRGIISIFNIYRKHEHTWHQEVSVVVTEEQAAPFSFFKWLFWRSDIDPDSENGQRMLQHELTHIREKHSTDKLFTELCLPNCC